MPPRGHSGSSHSSHSSSRSHSSSSHRSSSSRSSSSRSSSSRSSSSWGSSSSGRSGPSSHSTTSHSSRPASGSSRQWAAAPVRPPKKPADRMVYGYPRTTQRRPTRYVGRNHTYLYFPVGWTDTYSGKSYEAGYYDENGSRYENVAFAQQDGSYKNVLCECEYCGTRKVMDVEAGGSLQCEACGGTMKIVSTVDELVREETVDPGAVPERSAKSRKAMTLVFAILLAAVLITVFSVFSIIRKASSGPGVTQSWGNEDVIPLGGTNENYDYTVYLSKTGNGTYSVVNEGDAYDKQLVWNDEFESYYDAESDCYLWYNEEMDPPLWQYWYEGISSDYGDYGWMEYDEAEQQWYIEEKNGWSALPAQYDASRLWHIE